MSNKIATHNSGTGEPSDGWFSKLLVPFSRCQSLGLEKQFKLGVRYFDLRAKWRGNILFIQHGLWKSCITLEQAISLLNMCSWDNQEKVYIMVTYEGRLSKQTETAEFINTVKTLFRDRPRMVLTEINVKLPNWTLLEAVNPMPIKQDYTKIVGMKCLLPIPWLWWFFRKPEMFNDKTFTMIDFV